MREQDRPGGSWGHPRAPAECVVAAGTEVRLGHEPTSGPGSAGTGDWDLTAPPVQGLMAPGGWNGALYHGWGHRGPVEAGKGHWGLFASPIAWRSVRPSCWNEKYSNVHFQQQISMAKRDRNNSYEKICFDRSTDWHRESCYTHFQLGFLNDFFK